MGKVMKSTSLQIRFIPIMALFLSAVLVFNAFPQGADCTGAAAPHREAAGHGAAICRHVDDASSYFGGAANPGSRW